MTGPLSAERLPAPAGFEALSSAFFLRFFALDLKYGQANETHP